MSLRLTEAMGCAQQDKEVFKQTQESHLCEQSSSELRTCQTQSQFPEIQRNPMSDGFLGSSTGGASSHIPAAAGARGWDPGKRGPGIRGELQLCPLLHHRPRGASAPSANEPGGEKASALLDKANTPLAGQGAREGQTQSTAGKDRRG